MWVEIIVAALLGAWVILLMLMFLAMRASAIRLRFNWLLYLITVVIIAAIVVPSILFWSDIRSVLSWPEYTLIILVLVIVLVYTVARGILDSHASIWRPPKGFSASGMIVLVTGGNSGIGFAAAQQCAALGATVVIACRSWKRGQAAVDQMVASITSKKLLQPTVEMMQLDLSDLENVAAFTRKFRSKYNRIDVLINNAGMYPASGAKSKQGFELGLGAMQFGHFLLTLLLEDLILRAGSPKHKAVIINVASAGHVAGSFDDSLYEGDGEGDLRGEKITGGFSSYGRAKLANVLFTYEHGRRLAKRGVSNVVLHTLHPGAVYSNIWGQAPPGASHLIQSAAWFFMRPTPAAGVHLAGLAFSDAAQRSSLTKPWYSFCYVKPTRSSKLSHDERLAARLWEVSERVTKPFMNEADTAAVPAGGAGAGSGSGAAN